MGRWFRFITRKSLIVTAEDLAEFNMLTNTESGLPTSVKTRVSTAEFSQNTNIQDPVWWWRWNVIGNDRRIIINKHKPVNPVTAIWHNSRSRWRPIIPMQRRQIDFINNSMHVNRIRGITSKVLEQERVKGWISLWKHRKIWRNQD